MRTRSLMLSCLFAALGACASGPVNVAGHLPPEVTGPTWRWASTLTVYGELRPDASTYTLHFTDDNHVRIEAGCKAGSADVGVGDNRQLQIGMLQPSRNDCPGGDKVADEFLVDLGRVRQWSVKDGDLYLGTPGDASGMHFTPATAGTP